MAKQVKMIILVGLTGLLALGLAAQKTENPGKAKLAVSIKPQHVADALHAIIVSHREVYAHAIEGKQVAGLPTPCEMVRRGSEAVASKGVEYAYLLRSLQPINKRNAPETDMEIKGLEYVAKNPDSFYAKEELLGGRWYLTAVYPQVAVNQSCVQCHKVQPGKSNLKTGDVLGGLVIRIALEL